MTGIMRGMLVVAMVGAGLAVASAAQEPGRIDVTIRNFTFEFQGATIKPNQPAVITLKNLDKVTHGFMSPLLGEQEVEIEAKGATTYGRGMRGLHLNPGETATIRFMPMKPGRYKFECDIHPNMKGEILSLSIGEV
ncbi:MAG: cupredoxin domain-containing protein [Nitrospirae bacterium]|nr:cupredoxin domain-containing protein [Nitrospirota bacterium]